MIFCLYELCAAFYMLGKKKLGGVFQPTALDFSHVLTNEDGVSLPEVSEERKCGPQLLRTCETHLPDASSSGSQMGSGDPQQ